MMIMIAEDAVGSSKRHITHIAVRHYCCGCVQDVKTKINNKEAAGKEKHQRRPKVDKYDNFQDNMRNKLA